MESFKRIGAHHKGHPHLHNQKLILGVGYRCTIHLDDVRAKIKEDRPALARLLDMARPGDTIVIWRLDRLARSIRHLIKLADELKARGIDFCSLTDSIDTSTASGELHFHMLAALAQFERGLIPERVNAGLEAAWASGKKSGRKSADHPDKVATLARAQALIESGMSVTTAAPQSGIARATVYKYISETKTDGRNKRTGKQTVFVNGNATSAGVR